MTEISGKSLSRISTSGKLSHLTHDVEHLNKNYKAENDRIKRILQMLQGYNRQPCDKQTLRRVRSGDDLRKAGLWKISHTCRLRKFLMD